MPEGQMLNPLGEVSTTTNSQWYLQHNGSGMIGGVELNPPTVGQDLDRELNRPSENERRQSQSQRARSRFHEVTIKIRKVKNGFIVVIDEENQVASNWPSLQRLVKDLLEINPNDYVQSNESHPVIHGGVQGDAPSNGRA